MHRIIGLIAGATTLALGTWWALAGTGVASRTDVRAVSFADDRDPPSWQPQVKDSLEFQGARSCSSTACHGNIEADVRPGSIGRNEYHIWYERDPHSRAFEALVDDWSKDESESILKKLGIRFGDAQYQNCLACHSPSRFNAPSDRDAAPAATQYLATRDGVSCEACHGPAQRWRVEHYRDDWTAEKAAQSGMVSSKENLVVRARICAECHVGSKNREVNHDMIAAGHPPLHFEFTAYMDMLPRHWNDADERAATGDFELKLWAAGQVASADAALELLTARAEGKSRQGVWPEFSEYACFSCHHDLNLGTWRPERTYRDDSPAAPPWGGWYLSMLDRAVAQDSSDEARQLGDSLTALKAAMSQHYASDPAAVAQRAKQARTHLYQWGTAAGKLNAVGNRPSALAMLQAATGEAGDEQVPAATAVRSWDAATQLYLALVAADFAYRDELDMAGGSPTATHQAVREGLEQLRSQLAFPPQYHSPRGFVGAVQDDQSPREKFRRELLKLKELFEQLEQQ